MLLSLFEAARWAPSCFNEQPWLFLYATSTSDRNRFAEALVEKNREWAAQAPVLLFVAARRLFTRNGRPNRHAGFDTGAAWMSLALEARKLGLHTHAMAGFDQERAHDILELPRDEYEIFAAVALGRRGDRESLPPDVAKGESPNDRKNLNDMISEGRFTNKEE
jgi:nitroreductase